jgi:hypothetical protein
MRAHQRGVEIGGHRQNILGSVGECTTPDRRTGTSGQAVSGAKKRGDRDRTCNEGRDELHSGRQPDPADGKMK